jgi:hypothetical protein
MTTTDFEGPFLAHLEHLLTERHPTLQLSVPASGSYAGEPIPDFIVTNPETGAVLVGEVKSGAQAQHIPYSTLPQLRRIRDHYLSHRSAMVLITTSFIPDLVRDGLNRDGIAHIQVGSAEEAANRLETQLRWLEGDSLRA